MYPITCQSYQIPNKHSGTIDTCDHSLQKYQSAGCRRYNSAHESGEALHYSKGGWASQQPKWGETNLNGD